MSCPRCNYFNGTEVHVNEHIVGDTVYTDTFYVCDDCEYVFSESKEEPVSA